MIDRPLSEERLIQIRSAAEEGARYADNVGIISMADMCLEVVNEVDRLREYAQVDLELINDYAGTIAQMRELVVTVAHGERPCTCEEFFPWHKPTCRVMKARALLKVTDDLAQP